MGEDRIISALIGLVGACGSNPKTPNTDRVVIKALALPVCRPDLSQRELEAMVEEIHAEKNAVSPGCAACAMPCGNTSDYDMERLYQAKSQVRRLKLEILSQLRQLAVKSGGGAAAGEEADAEFFYKALAWVSCDLSEEQLLELLDETRRLYTEGEGHGPD